MNPAWLLSFKDMKLKRSIRYNHSTFVFVTLFFLAELGKKKELSVKRPIFQ